MLLSGFLRNKTLLSMCKVHASFLLKRCVVEGGVCCPFKQWTKWWTSQHAKGTLKFFSLFPSLSIGSFWQVVDWSTQIFWFTITIIYLWHFSSYTMCTPIHDGFYTLYSNLYMGMTYNREITVGSVTPIVSEFHCTSVGSYDDNSILHGVLKAKKVMDAHG